MTFISSIHNIQTFQFRPSLTALLVLIRVLALSVTVLNSGSAIANSDESLPILGDHLSGVISADKEREIGRLLLRQLRTQMPLIVDPLTNDYLQEISYRLVANSQLNDRRIDTLIVNDDSINAFAMPGGVIAVNTGLFLHAKTEDEFSAVLSHEIAHLSQRHFARMLAAQKNAKLPTIGAYLASIAILLTAGTEPGLGALAATQAASQQNALSFSRKNEQEADRIGMQTMVDSKLDPNAMAQFFWELQRSTQYAGFTPPEYLLTHPVTESRISDAKSRARKFPKSRHEANLEYQLIRMRLKVYNEEDPADIIENLKANAAKGHTTTQKANSYALSLAYAEGKKYRQARKYLKPLLKKDPTRIAFQLADAEISFSQERFDETNRKLVKALKIHPNNYSLSMLYAETLIRQKKNDKAIYLLKTLVIDKQQNPYIWRLLVDAYGQKGDRINIYRAKAQYFYLYGLNDQAIAQLSYALPLAEDNYQLKSKIATRIEEIKLSQKEIKL